MDDTAQSPQTQQNQQNTQVPPAQTSVGQTPPVVPQPTLRPTDSVGQTPVAPVSGGRPEQGPVGSGLPQREAAPVDEAEAVSTATDDQVAIPDEASDVVDANQQESVDVKLQEQPQVEVAPELEKAGVEKGEDADQEQLPGEQLAKPDDNAAQPSPEDLLPDTQAAASGISITSSPVQLKAVQKKNGIRNSIRWLATELGRQLKRMAMKPEDQKTNW